MPTTECGVSRKDPVGNTKPTLPPSTTTGNTPPKGPSSGAKTATIINGNTTSAIANGKGLTVTTTSSGTITVTNTDHSSVTMAGGYVTLRDAASVQAGPGLAVHRLPNGDVLVTSVLKASRRLIPQKISAKLPSMLATLLPRAQSLLVLPPP